MKRDGQIVDIPLIDPSMALTFRLTGQFLEQLFPPMLFSSIRPYLDRSDEVLKELDSLDRWSNKVKIVSRTQPLLPAAIKPEVIAIIYEALLYSKQFSGSYENRSGSVNEYGFHPQALIFRESVIYLVATVQSYSDPRHYALHRFQDCQLKEEAATGLEGFDLDSYIHSGAFEYLDSEEEVIDLAPNAALHLEETPLSANQTIEKQDDGRMEVRAQVKNSQQLRWWLLGFGQWVEVVEPVALKDEMKEVFAAGNRAYSK